MAAQKTVEFIIDLASPNAYLVNEPLKAIVKRTGAKLKYTPCLLGGIFKATNNQAPMIAFGGIKNKLEYDRLEMQRFIARHKLTKFVLNPHFPINTLLLMRGAVAMDIDGKVEAYIEAMLPPMWEHGRDMNDPDVVKAEWAKAGFDADHLLERTKSQEVKAVLLENTQMAVERGAFGIPTFFVGDEMFFGKERLGQVEEALG